MKFHPEFIFHQVNSIEFQVQGSTRWCRLWKKMAKFFVRKSCISKTTKIFVSYRMDFRRAVIFRGKNQMYKRYHGKVTREALGTMLIDCWYLAEKSLLAVDFWYLRMPSLKGSLGSENPLVPCLFTAATRTWYHRPATNTYFFLNRGFSSTIPGLQSPSFSFLKLTPIWWRSCNT